MFARVTAKVSGMFGIRCRFNGCTCIQNNSVFKYIKNHTNCFRYFDDVDSQT